MIEILCSGLEDQMYSIDSPHKLGTAYENRTRLSALKGQRPKPIDEHSINLVDSNRIELLPLSE
jgi:hypothetical protein